MIFGPVNKKVIGKTKDEFKGKIISEFVGLKSKMCSLVDLDGEESKQAKGVNKNVAKNTRHKEFVDVLFNKTGTYNVCKIYLSCFDDKRYMLGDGINSSVYFHKDTRSQQYIC